MPKIKSFALSDHIVKAFISHCEYYGILQAPTISEMIWNLLQGTESPDAKIHMESYERYCRGGKWRGRKPGFNPFRDKQQEIDDCTAPCDLK